MDVFEVMETCRAMRYLKPDPVPREMIEQLVFYATRAPSPRNTQEWDFVIVTDEATKQRIGDVIGDRITARVASYPPPDNEADRRMNEGSLTLAQSLANAPVLILVCGPTDYPRGRPIEKWGWASLFPAAQNLMLAARALGLGSTLTTFNDHADSEIREWLELPDDVRIACMLPIGWPARDFGPVRRRPVDEVIHWERWQPDLRPQQGDIAPKD